MSTLAEFILARVAEDEAMARVRPEHYAPFEREWEWCPKARTEPLGDLGGPDDPCECGVDSWQPDPRALRESRAMRRIVALHDGAHECSCYDHTGDVNNCAWVLDGDDCSTLRDLAEVWSDHPDYRQEWRP